MADIADGTFAVQWGTDADLSAAYEIHRAYRGLELGLVDAMVIAAAERLGASAIATLDHRYFGAVKIRGNPQLLPRDA